MNLQVYWRPDRMCYLLFDHIRYISIFTSTNMVIGQGPATAASLILSCGLAAPVWVEQSIVIN